MPDRPMTVPEYVAHARKLLTPEPWHVADRGIGWEIHRGLEPEKGCWPTQAHGMHPECPMLNDGQRDTFSYQDAQRIVAAHNDLVLRLCAVVEAQRNMLLTLEGTLSAYKSLTSAENNVHDFLAQPTDAFTTEDV